jgi:membrane carboxypeptidase/penicillin-binding protein PbpC
MPKIAEFHASETTKKMEAAAAESSKKIHGKFSELLTQRLAEARTSATTINESIQKKLEEAKQGITADAKGGKNKPETLKDDHDSKVVASLDESRFLTGVRNKLQEDHLAVARSQLQLGQDLIDRADKQQETLDKIAANTEGGDDDGGDQLSG